MKEFMLFAGRALSSPRLVGAVAPASPALGRAIADEVWRTDVRTILEVGGGTGSITRCLCAGDAASVIVIEKDEYFARHLTKAFPDVLVINGCAGDIGQLLPYGADAITIVSSLPFRSMSKPQADICQQELIELVARNRRSRLIQYTYGIFGGTPWRVGGADMYWQRAKVVWGNIPPASIWVLSHKPFCSTSAPK